MVIKPFTHLARQSFGKTFAHGYAQSVVAATQSSYASTTTPFASFSPYHSNRVGRPGTAQAYSSFHHAPASVGSAGKSVGSPPTDVEGSDAALGAYFDAWQKHLHSDEAKEWKQFQFPRRVGWKQTPATNNDSVPQEQNDIETRRKSRSDAPILERSYSTSAVDDIKKVEGEVAETQGVSDDTAFLLDDIEGAEAYRLSKDAAAKTTVQISQVAVDQSPQSSTRLSSSSSSPPVSGEELTPSTTFSELPNKTPPQDGESRAFFQHIDDLYQSKSFAQIPAIFESMLASGIQPNTKACKALLAAATHTSRPDHQAVSTALNIYAYMLKTGIKPDLPFFSDLLELLSQRAINVVRQRRVLEQQQQRFSVAQNEAGFFFRSHETELAIVSEDDALPMAVSIFRNAILNSDLTLPAAVYDSLVTACALHSATDEMVQVYTHMEARNVKASATLFPPMIEAFGKSGDLSSAVECYNEYKSLAIEDDNGKTKLTNRQDNAVYAAVVKAYAVCGRSEGGNRFTQRIIDSLADVTENRKEKLEDMQDTVGFSALIKERLLARDFAAALKIAEQQKLTPKTRDSAIREICVSAADSSNLDVATKAYQYLSATDSLNVDATLALISMHSRAGNNEAALSLWNVSGVATHLTDSSIEAVTYFASGLVEVGRSSEGLSIARQAFAHIRDSHKGPALESATTAEIDEALELLTAKLCESSSPSTPDASTGLLWAMAENGGFMSQSAKSLLASLSPDDIVALSWQDKMLVLQAEAGLIGSEGSALDMTHQYRFAHVLSSCMREGIPLDERSTGLVKKALARLSSDLSGLSDQWRRYHEASIQTSAPDHAFQESRNAVHLQLYGPYADTFDPYAAKTDHKGSAIIAEILESRRNISGLNEALAKFRNIRRSGRHPRPAAYAKLITAAVKEGRFGLTDDIIGMARTDIPYMTGFPTLQHGWSSILDAMLGACLAAKQPGKADLFHQELLSIGSAPTANTYGLYITSLNADSTKTFDEATEAVKIFNRALSEGVVPSSFLYNALIGKLGKARRIDDCLRYFQEMRNAGVRPTSVTYGTIVNALCRVSDERFAEELFDEMESMPNYKPRTAPYNSVMQFFLTTKRDSRKVLAYFDRMMARNIEPTSHTYKLLIDTYATLEPVNMTAAEGVLEELRSLGKTPEAVHYAALIHAKGCVHHDLAGARQVFEDALARGQVQASACLYQALFESMVANHAVSQTESILDSMSANRVQITAYIANTLIHGWATENKIAKSKAIFDSVQLSKREPSTYEAMTRAFLTAEDRDSAMSVVHEMLSRGYPSAVSGKILELVGHASKA